MSTSPQPPEGSAGADAGAENRRHPRIFEPFPATPRGVDSNGDPFDITTMLDNFSAGGLYLRLPQHLKPGAKVFAVVRLSTSADPTVPAPLVAARGVVVAQMPNRMAGVAWPSASHATDFYNFTSPLPPGEGGVRVE